MSEEKRKYLADESGHGMARPMVTVLVIMGIAIAYWVWPEGITEQPLDEIPMSDLVQALGSLLVGLFTLGVAVRAWLDS